jgi:hypothetical protein
MFGPVDQYFVATDGGQTRIFSLKNGNLVTQEEEGPAEGVLAATLPPAVAHQETPAKSS